MHYLNVWFWKYNYFLNLLANQRCRGFLYKHPADTLHLNTTHNQFSMSNMDTWTKDTRIQGKHTIESYNLSREKTQTAPLGNQTQDIFALTETSEVAVIREPESDRDRERERDRLVLLMLL